MVQINYNFFMRKRDSEVKFRPLKKLQLMWCRFFTAPKHEYLSPMSDNHKNEWSI